MVMSYRGKRRRTKKMMMKKKKNSAQYKTYPDEPSPD
jgi:hypothetical protein